jgi:hypothetical protein
MLPTATGQSFWQAPSNGKAIFCSEIRPISGLNTALNCEKLEGSSKVVPRPSHNTHPSAREARTIRVNILLDGPN